MSPSLLYVAGSESLNSNDAFTEYIGIGGLLSSSPAGVIVSVSVSSLLTVATTSEISLSASSNPFLSSRACWSFAS